MNYTEVGLWQWRFAILGGALLALLLSSCDGSVEGSIVLPPGVARGADFPGATVLALPAHNSLNLIPLCNVERATANGGPRSTDLTKTGLPTVQADSQGHFQILGVPLGATLIIAQGNGDFRNQAWMGQANVKKNTPVTLDERNRIGLDTLCSHKRS